MTPIPQPSPPIPDPHPEPPTEPEPLPEPLPDPPPTNPIPPVEPFERHLRRLIGENYALPVSCSSRRCC